MDELWNPGTARVTRRLAGVLAASPTAIAQASRCTPACRVQVLALATGRRTTISLPAGDSAASGSFSPGGALLALQVSSVSSGDGGALAVRLEVAAVASGALTPVPGTFASSDALVGFGWPARGDRLVAEYIFTTRAQLASWHPGAARPAVADIQPGPAVAALILGSQ